MKVGDKFKPNKKFFEQFPRCRELKIYTENGNYLKVDKMPSKSKKYKYGVELNGLHYGFNDEHVIPFKIVLENK